MEVLKHECGVAMVRLLKPLEYYHEKYGSWMYGLNKLYLLMEKQHNRGQEGAGLALSLIHILLREVVSGSPVKVIGCTKDLNYDLFANANYKEGTMPYVEMKKEIKSRIVDND